VTTSRSLGPPRPRPVRWAVSVALALSLPLALVWAGHHLGPGPHAAVRVELALVAVAPGAHSIDRGRESLQRGPASPRTSRTASGLTSKTGIPTPQMREPVLLRAALQEPAALADNAEFTQDQHVRHTDAPSVTVMPSPSASVLEASPLDAPVGEQAAIVGSHSTPGPAIASNLAADAGAPQTGALVSPDALDPGFGLVQPVRPEYPRRALDHGAAGQARIEIEIEPSGDVGRVSVLEETETWGFGSAAERAYRLARFTPPRVRGTPVRVLLRKTLVFEP
jgi:TonB family protein